MTGLDDILFEPFAAYGFMRSALVGIAALALANGPIGVLLVTWRGSNVDLMHVLFGTILAVDLPTLVLMAILASVSVLALAAVYRPLLLESVDPGFLQAISGGGQVYRLIFLVLVVLDLEGTPPENPTVRRSNRES